MDNLKRLVPLVERFNSDLPEHNKINTQLINECKKELKEGVNNTSDLEPLRKVLREEPLKTKAELQKAIDKLKKLYLD